MSQEVRVPDIGDFDAVEVIELCAAVGDQVGPDDPLVVIESDKASMEIPAGASGTIEKIEVKVGDQVGEGDLIALLADTESDNGDAEPDASEADDEESPQTGQEEEPSAKEEASAKEEQPAEEEQSRKKEQPAEDEHPGNDAEADRSGKSESIEVRVPDIGDATDVAVIEVAVSEGDRVTRDDLLVVVESDKASMEIPAGHDGTVSAIHVAVGDSVEEGTLLATLEVAGSDRQSKAGSEKTEKTQGDTEDSAAVEKAAKTEAAQKADAEQKSADEKSAAGDGDEGSEESGRERAGTEVYAGPAVRRLARELGVDLSQVEATGSRGRIVKDDVKAYVKTELGRDRGTEGSGIPRVPEIDFSRFGEVETVPLSKIRAAGAVNLHRSWLNLPHVTQFEDADVTELEEFRRSLKQDAERRGVKITPLAFIVKACCHALKTHPTFNASLDAQAKNFILKRYYNIGFAVDTEEGLVVPVIRGADKLGIWELSEAISELADKARNRKLGMNEMQGGTFSISSLGGIGGTGFTPIINAPEVAILGVSRLITKPVWDGAAFEPRQMLPLSLSYDHRAINGAEAGRFMVSLAELLADIRRLAL